jgi:hypothetical protein
MCPLEWTIHRSNPAEWAFPLEANPQEWTILPLESSGVDTVMLRRWALVRQMLNFPAVTTRSREALHAAQFFDAPH